MICFEEYLFSNKNMNLDEYNYFNYLLYPDKYKEQRIPSKLGITTACFQRKTTIQGFTNSKGCFLLSFNPYVLTWNTGFPITLSIDNKNVKVYGVSGLSTFFSEELDGTTIDTNPQPIYFDTFQNIPALYSSFRLVSASLTVRGGSNIKDSAGVIGGGVFFEQSSYVNVNHIPNEAYGVFTASNNPFLRKYMNFALIRDSVFYQEAPASEGVRLLYFPPDNSFEEFVNMKKLSLMPESEGYKYIFSLKDCLKTGFQWVVFGEGLPPLSYDVQINICYNFECLAMPDCLAYVQVGRCKESLLDSMKFNINKYIQDLLRKKI